MIRMYSSPPSSRWVCTTIAARLRRPFPPSSSAPRLPRCAAGRRRHQDRQKQASPLRSSRRALPGSCDSSSRPTRRSSCTYRLVRTISYVHTITIALPSCDGVMRKWPSRKPLGKPLGVNIVARDQQVIHFRCAAPPTANPDKYRDELLDAYLFVEDADALYAEYAAQGVEFTRGLGNMPWHKREFVVKDCDGRLLAFGANL